MLSRVGVVGASSAESGASGKTTAIKLLIGELKPEVGAVFRHPGMRLAYVKQAAFHFLEKHMDKTPVQYIMWRFAGNEDRESLENQTKQIKNVDEEALRKIKWCVDSRSSGNSVRKCVIGEKGDVPIAPECILKRRTNEQENIYEYEVKMMHNKPLNQPAIWIERDTMVAMGYEKLVCREDERAEAAAISGLTTSRGLTAASVEKALMEDFGLDDASDILGSLSGCQKMKVVLTAAMWQNPHVLILDEPSSYFDRDGLKSLFRGLRDFGGGVVIISHSTDFIDLCGFCTEKWIMDAGRLTVSLLHGHHSVLTMS